MFSNSYGDMNSQSVDARLPSLLALRCFEAAARLENFSHAAVELHLTHGAVSRAVRLLEEELGVSLFDRRSRRVFLTEAGRTLSRAVSSGMGLMRQAVAEVRASTRSERRWVVSCEPTLLMRWLIPRISGFQSMCPDVDIQLVAGGGAFSFVDGIDLAIRRNDFSWPDSCHVETLFSERVGPVCRPDMVTTWFSTRSGCVKLKASAPVLHTRTRPTAWEEWSKASGLAQATGPGKTFEHFYFSLQAAVAGLGVAIGPWHLVRDDLDNGLLSAPLGFVEDESSYCLLSPRPLPPDSPQAGLLAWLREVA